MVYRAYHGVTETAGKYLHNIYAAVIHEIQTDRIFLQRVIKDTGKAFSGVEKVLQGFVLPHLIFGKSKTLPLVVVTLSTLPVNKAGLGPQNPVKSSA